MKNFSLDQFTHDKKIIIFGAGHLGILTFHALSKMGLKTDFFYDSDVKKQNKKLLGIEVLEKKNFLKENSNSIIIICNNYIDSTLNSLMEFGFKNYFDCTEMLESVNFDDLNINKIQEEHQHFDYLKKYDEGKTYKNINDRWDRFIQLHKNSHLYASTEKSINKNEFKIKYFDVVVTERCSMKCIDCSNLMQYYQNAENSEYDELIYSLDRFMDSVDEVYEARVIGGEPFVNRDLYKILEHMLTYDHLKNIVIYTNGQHVPKGPTLEVLKNDRIKLDISNYKLVGRSKNHDKLIDVCVENNVNYATHIAKTWQDCGRIKFQDQNPEQLTEKFMNCCVNDTLSVLNGKVYRCPFSANVHNLKAIPDDPTDVINVADKSIPLKEIKSQLESLYKRKDKKQYISACNYCGGRDFSTPEIKAAIQTKIPILF